jgi:micrococcal nuclease
VSRSERPRRRRLRRRSLLLALCCLVATAGCGGAIDATPTATTDGTAARVTDVVDGDTLDVRLADGTEDTVRLLGVDTPEVHVETTPAEFEGVPETAAGRACLRRQGERASAYAVEMLAGERVTLRFDAAAGRRGGYDRLLAYVVVDGDAFNAALLERGHARLYDGSFRERDLYAALERAAREAGRGVWSCTTA